MEKRVILLNGPSSSGKSTLAHALQSRILERKHESYPVLSIDDYLPMTPDRPIYEDDVYEINAAFMRDAADALRAAPGVILDHVMTSERIYLQFAGAFASARSVLVRVTCPLSVLIEREQARGNRCPGSAEASSAYLFPKDGYAYTVDTHGATPDACADALYQYLFPEENV